MPVERINIAPQDGPQEAFLATTADIALYGGGAGGGKSFALLMEPLRHINNPKFGTVIFRRNATQVKNEGGLWDESENLYPLLGAKPREFVLEWNFPSGFRIKFSHLEDDKAVYNWQGAQVPLIGWDELTHFTEKQFFYLMSRNRSDSGVSGYMRATCNPDADSWVRKFIDWWIGPDGFPIKERSGVLRWFIRQDEVIIWADTREELVSQYGDKQRPKSFTFIAALIHDNKILMEKDPNYLSNLLAQSRVDRMRLLEGNWNVKATAGTVFRKEWFEIIQAHNTHVIRKVRYWDRAATKPNETNKDPDWTRGLLLYKLNTGIWVVADVVSIRDTPLKVEQCIKNTATRDGSGVEIIIEQDPGSSGVADADNYIRLLAGFNVRKRSPTKDKLTRAKPVSAQCEAGNVKLLQGNWNDEFLTELESFPEGNHDDQVDVLSGAFNEMAGGLSILDAL